MDASTRQSLIDAACQSRDRAYAPYSKFAVGAAVLTVSGEIYAGCNVENGSYGLTLCAERVAVGSAIAAGELSIVAVAVASDPAAMPCGACRQVLCEFGEAMEVISVGVDDRSIEQTTLDLLLPRRFESPEGPLRGEP